MLKGVRFFDILFTNQGPTCKTSLFNGCRVCKFCDSGIYTHHREEEGHAIYRQTQGMAAATPRTLCRVQLGKLWWPMLQEDDKPESILNSFFFCFCEGLWPRNYIWPQDGWENRKYTRLTSINCKMGIWPCKLSLATCSS